LAEALPASTPPKRIDTSRMGGIQNKGLAAKVLKCTPGKSFSQRPP
jgi:hypothetical protein